MQRLLETGAEDERTQEASKFLELLLCLLRNLLVVPDSGSAAHNGPRARTQDAVSLRSEWWGVRLFYLSLRHCLDLTFVQTCKRRSADSFAVSDFWTQ